MADCVLHRTTASRWAAVAMALCLSSVGLTQDNDARRLHLAAAAGDLTQVTALLAKGVPVDAASQGSTPLHHAAQKGHVAVVERLLAKGADANARTPGGISPVHFAAQGGHIRVVELLLANGVDVNAPTGDGLPPLAYAALGGRLDVAKLLVARKARLANEDELMGTALHSAAIGGDVPTIEYLLSLGLKVDAGRFGVTPLSLAAEHGRIEAMKLLMSRGARADDRVDYAPSDGETPLFKATRHGQVEAMKLLIERGASVNAKDSDGRTPLFELVTLTALRPNQKEAMLLLLAHKAEVNLKTRSAGKTLLALAAENQNGQAIEILKAHGAQ